MSGKCQQNLFFSRLRNCQGILWCVRENEIWEKFREMSWNSTFQHDEARMFGPDIFFLLNLSNFRLWYCHGNLNLCQGNVRAFWSFLNVWTVILNVNWCMNIIIWDYEVVWSNSRPKSKRRTLWPIFHSPVILCYILRTIWCITIIFWDWPIFHSPVISTSDIARKHIFHFK